MFTHALPQGSLRPFEPLPPTLTPNAILAMAPPAPRRLGFLGACIVYTACGAGLMYAPAIQTRLLKPTTVTLIISDPTKATTLPVMAQQSLPVPRPGLVMKGAPKRPEGWTPPLDLNTVPVTPTTLPSVDNSRLSARAAEPEDADRKALPQEIGGTPRPATSAVLDYDFRQMRILSKVDPSYPPIARLAKIQGEVVLLMVVDPHGLPTEVKALSGPHPSLEMEAMRVARLWRFEPATMNGQPVSAQFKLTILFRLK